MKVLITGVAGFIGFHLCRELLKEGYEVVGIDNINDYYDVDLKYSRLKELGIHKKEIFPLKFAESKKYTSSFRFLKIDIEDKEKMISLFEEQKFNTIIHLAAQVGVRYSIENPDVYIQSNIVGFFNVLECCRIHNIKYLIYATSSSVYGANEKTPFKETDNVDRPISLYATTKKSNELMAHTYSHLYKITTTGLRFFTVYGPWGRPDMAPFLFADAISKGEQIKVFNEGNMQRDFTYVEDVVDGIKKVVENKLNRKELYKIYNLGNSKPINLLSFIDEIESNLKIKAIKKMLPLQQGDLVNTWANIDSLKKEYNYQPKTTVKQGVKSYISWFTKYYNN